MKAFLVAISSVLGCIILLLTSILLFISNERLSKENQSYLEKINSYSIDLEKHDKEIESHISALKACLNKPITRSPKIITTKELINSQKEGSHIGLMGIKCDPGQIAWTEAHKIDTPNLLNAECASHWMCGDPAVSM